eukprot:1154780-Pelagomonas_calceolata.AAC.1
MATEVAVLLLGGLKLILGPGVFTVSDFHKMDVPLFWKELVRVTDLGSRDLQVLYSKTICAAYVHGGKTCPKGAFVDAFKQDSASDIMAFDYNI